MALKYVSQREFHYAKSIGLMVAAYLVNQEFSMIKSNDHAQLQLKVSLQNVIKQYLPIHSTVAYHVYKATL
jgi:hypothetical protein